MASEGGGLSDPAAPFVLALAIILVPARVGGDLATRVKQLEARQRTV